MLNKLDFRLRLAFPLYSLSSGDSTRNFLMVSKSVIPYYCHMPIEFGTARCEFCARYVGIAVLRVALFGSGPDLLGIQSQASAPTPVCSKRTNLRRSSDLLVPVCFVQFTLEENR